MPKIVLAATVLASIGLAAGLVVWLTGGSSEKQTLSHAAYMQLFVRATPGKTTTAVLDTWPKPPYQDYHDGFQNHCYEWIDKAIALQSIRLYNLCFKHGKLVSKSLA
jgi:hypothetical protein